MEILRFFFGINIYFFGKPCFVRCLIFFCNFNIFLFLIFCQNFYFFSSIFPAIFVCSYPQLPLYFLPKFLFFFAKKNIFASISIFSKFLFSFPKFLFFANFRFRVHQCYGIFFLENFTKNLKISFFWDRPFSVFLGRRRWLANVIVAYLEAYGM